MNLKFLVLAVLLGGTMTVYADQTVEEAQRVLKEQGFYYGQATGTKDADTLAAIRRYQIRNGLNVTGELDAETLASLRSAPANSAPRTAVATPTPAVRDTTTSADNSVARDTAIQPALGNDDESVMVAPAVTPALRVAPTAMFAGTPYESAPPPIQRSVVAAAQEMLAQRGYYRGAIDGAYGPATEFALRAYQSQAGIQPSGVFDMETLASMQMLPAQHVPRRYGPRRPSIDPPAVRGEWIHE